MLQGVFEVGDFIRHMHPAGPVGLIYVGCEAVRELSLTPPRFAVNDDVHVVDAIPAGAGRSLHLQIF